jgi:hypothetical protein
MSIPKNPNTTARASRVQPAAQAMPEPAKAGGIAAMICAQASLTPVINGESSGSEAAALRLEKRTHLNTAKYRINLIDYGHGVGEIGWSFISTTQPVKTSRGKSENRVKNKDRSMRRSRSKMRKLILTTKADHLLTLTYRDNVTDFAQSAKDFSSFIRKVKFLLPDFIYIAVAEQQKRGAWHWHLAVRGRQDVNLLRLAWRSVVGDGNIDVNAPRSAQKGRQFALIQYLGKYLGKGFADGEHKLNARRFRASQGIKIPHLSIELPNNDRNVLGFAIETLRHKVGSVGHVWTSDDCTAGWACSWK